MERNNMRVEIWNKKTKKFQVIKDVYHVYNGCTFIGITLINKIKLKYDTNKFDLMFIYDLKVM